MSRPHDPLSLTEQDREAAKPARQREADDWKWLMSSKQGRRIAWRLLERAGIYRTSFTGNSETFFREGMRQMGLHILGDIQAHAPESIAQMFTEARETA